MIRQGKTRSTRWGLLVVSPCLFGLLLTPPLPGHAGVPSKRSWNLKQKHYVYGNHEILISPDRLKIENTDRGFGAIINGGKIRFYNKLDKSLLECSTSYIPSRPSLLPYPLYRLKLRRVKKAGPLLHGFPTVRYVLPISQIVQQLPGIKDDNTLIRDVRPVAFNFVKVDMWCTEKLAYRKEYAKLITMFYAFPATSGIPLKCLSKTDQGKRSPELVTLSVSPFKPTASDFNIGSDFKSITSLEGVFVDRNRRTKAGDLFIDMIGPAKSSP